MTELEGIIAGILEDRLPAWTPADVAEALAGLAGMWEAWMEEDE